MTYSSRHAHPIKVQCTRPGVVDLCFPVWMVEREHLLRVRKGRESMHLHNVGRLEVLLVLVRLHHSTHVSIVVVPQNGMQTSSSSHNAIKIQVVNKYTFVTAITQSKLARLLTRIFPPARY